MRGALLMCLIILANRSTSRGDGRQRHVRLAACGHVDPDIGATRFSKCVLDNSFATR
jgi:hypothetical protein